MPELVLQFSVLINIDQIQRTQSDLDSDSLALSLPDNVNILGNAHWENFMTAIQRAIESCETTGYKAEHHFRGVTKMVALGSGSAAFRIAPRSPRKRPTKHHLTEGYQLVTSTHASVPPP